MVPCLYCCDAMFCNNVCRQAAWVEFHKILCPIGCNISQMRYSHQQELSLRIAAVTLHKYNFGKLEQMITANNADPRTKGFIRSANNSLICSSDSYAMIHNLQTSIESRSPRYLFYIAFVAATMVHLLKGFTLLKSDLESPGNVIILSEILFRQLLVTISSTLSIEQLSSSDGCSDETIGHGVYGFHSMFNHSCAPNMFRCELYIGGKMHTMSMANRQISINEEICDSYLFGAHHTISNKAKRQKELWEQYFFHCKCEACERNYSIKLPLLHDVQLNLVTKSTYNLLKQNNIKHAKKMLPKLIKQLNQLNSRKPSEQAFELQEAIKHCVAILTRQR